MKNGKQILFWVVAVILIMAMMNGQKEGKKESLINYVGTTQADCETWFNTNTWTCRTSCNIITQEIISCIAEHNIHHDPIEVGGPVIYYKDTLVIGSWDAFKSWNSCDNLGVVAGEDELALYQCLGGITPQECTNRKSSAMSSILSWTINPTLTNKNNALSSIDNWAGTC